MPATKVAQEHRRRGPRENKIGGIRHIHVVHTFCSLLWIWAIPVAGGYGMLLPVECCIKIKKVKSGKKTKTDTTEQDEPGEREASLRGLHEYSAHLDRVTKAENHGRCCHSNTLPESSPIPRDSQNHTCCRDVVKSLSRLRTNDETISHDVSTVILAVTRTLCFRLGLLV